MNPSRLGKRGILIIIQSKYWTNYPRRCTIKLSLMVLAFLTPMIMLKPESMGYTGPPRVTSDLRRLLIQLSAVWMPKGRGNKASRHFQLLAVLTSCLQAAPHKRHTPAPGVCILCGFISTSVALPQPITWSTDETMQRHYQEAVYRSQVHDDRDHQDHP